MEIIEENNRVVLVENETEAGEMTWSNKGDDNLVIDHTYVNEAYRGLGYAEKLVFAGVEIARRDGKKIIPLCPFAKKEFTRHKSYEDVLKNSSGSRAE